MKLPTSEPGFYVSAAAHGALVVAILVGLSQAKQFDASSDPIAVEMISADQLSQIADGEEQAKQIQPQPHQAQQVSDVVQPAQAPPAAAAPEPQPQIQPQPQPQPQAAAQPPLPADPPQPPVRSDPPPQQSASAQAQAQPTPADVPLPPVEAKSPPPDATAPDAIQPPEPPVRTHVDTKVAANTPLPPTKTKPLPKVDPKQKNELKLDQVAQLLDEQRIEDFSRAVDEPSPRRKNADPPADASSRFDPNSISRLLAKDAPQQNVPSAHDLSTTSSIGAANATAAKMSVSMESELDGLMLEQYRQCWSYLGLSQDKQYIPEIKVEYNQDGSLITEPSLLNPPSDPDLQSLAESALRAVRKCNPMHIPTQFAPYYQEWRARTLRFDPQDMSG